MVGDCSLLIYLGGVGIVIESGNQWQLNWMFTCVWSKWMLLYSKQTCHLSLCTHTHNRFAIRHKLLPNLSTKKSQWREKKPREREKQDLSSTYSDDIPKGNTHKRFGCCAEWTATSNRIRFYFCGENTRTHMRTPATQTAIIAHSHHEFSFFRIRLCVWYTSSAGKTPANRFLSSSLYFFFCNAHIFRFSFLCCGCCWKMIFT